MPLQRIGEDCPEQSTKFLGIYLDEFLNWKAHISHLNRKLSRALFAIKQIKHFFPHVIQKTLYYALVHPHIEYGILAWGGANSSILRHTVVMQKRAMRYIHNSTYNSHADPLFKLSSIMKLEDVYNYQMALFMYDLSHKKNFHYLLTPPSNLLMKFSHRVTRQSLKMYIPKCHTEFVRKLHVPLYLFPKAWNKWSDIICAPISRNQSKKHIKSTFINSYHDKIKCTNRHCKDCWALV